MATYSCVPAARLYVFHIGRFSGEFATTVEYVEVYYGVEQHRPAVTFAACGCAYTAACLVDNR